MPTIPHSERLIISICILLCAEKSVAAIADTRNNIGILVQTLVNSAAYDIHIRVRSLECL